MENKIRKELKKIIDRMEGEKIKQALVILLELENQS